MKVINRWTEDHKIWLFDLAHGNLKDKQILQGFAEHYLSAGMSTRAVCRDVCLAASATAARETGERLMKIFRKLAGEADAT